MKWLLITLAVLLALITAALAAAVVYIYRRAFYSPNENQNDSYQPINSEQHLACRDESLKMIADVDSIPYEKVSIKSFDGLNLCARYYHASDDAPVDICMHGYRGTPVRDFSGGARFLIDEGHNVLLIYERAHGDSEGHTITLGVKERYDCISWINYINNRFGKDKPITLYGISMGAATVIMAAELGLPENVKCIIADCPYSSPAEIVKKCLRDMGLEPKLTYPFVCLTTLLTGRFLLSAANAADAAKKTDIPILILHGGDDRFVPCEMSEEIAKANPSTVRREVFPTAGHGLSFMVDRERYIRVVREFLASVDRHSKKEES